MKTFTKSKLLFLALCTGLTLAPVTNQAEDVDLFVGTVDGASYNPNVLIVIDNSANWSRAAQHWPGGVMQGQSEARAIKNAISGLNNSINIGLQEHPTLLSAMDGGWIRQAVVPMSGANIVSFSARLDSIFNNINDSSEKTNGNIGYGGMLFDSFKYFGGYTSPAHATDNIAGTPEDRTHFGPNAFALPSHVPTTLADPNGYITPYTTFKSPITTDNNCGKNFIIFIANNAQGNLPPDDPALLTNVNCSTARIARPNLIQSTTTFTGTVGNSAACYTSATSCTSATGTEFPTQCGANGSYTSCTCTTAVPDAATCPAGSVYYSVIGTKAAGSYNLGYDSSCVSNVGQCSSADYAAQCATYDGGCSCSSSDSITTGCNNPKKRYMVVARQITPNSTNLGYTSQCYAPTATCSTTDYAAQCATYLAPGGCACGTPTTDTKACATGSLRYTVAGSFDMLTATPTGTYTTPTDSTYGDNWARCLYQTDVNAVTGQQNVTTFVIDVYKDQQNAAFTSLLMSMAKQGGGKYYAATSEQAIQDILKEILTEIQGVNSTFASASLPVNATNRSQNENQVFIGMFRPDPNAKPRWFGNMKRYQLINNAGEIDLSDVNGTQSAVSSSTGFVQDCATSFWTTDSGAYWQDVTVNPAPIGKCSTDAYSDYSDAPDGPQVEKGAVAEVLRKGNNPPATNTTPTWAVNRTVYTGAMGPFTTTTLGTSTESVDVANFTLGHDVKDERANGNQTETRPSIHGDVVHSRPLPVNYGGTTGVTVYYGANEGSLRAVDAATGKERWAYIAPEHYGKLQRLFDNQPLVNYPNTFLTPPTPAPLPKDYFFDGSIGVYQTFDATTNESTAAWIFPTMRRGGRMVYAFDVSNPDSPSFKWKAGCPNMGNDTGCTTDISGIGQTWSIPAVAKVKGYTKPDASDPPKNIPAPIILMGGGYDACEDADTSSPSCGSPKGNKIFVLDADNGTVLQSFDTIRSVASDVAMVDVDYDGYVDYAYAADLGGNIYRVNFIDTTKAALGKDDWASHKVAYTNGHGRKFFYPPAVMPASDKVFLALGSGDREHPLQSHYPYNNIVNRFYVYLDNPASNVAIDLDLAANAYDYTAATTCDTAKLLPGSTKRAWFMDLNCPTVNGVLSCPAKTYDVNGNVTSGCGEQTVTSAIIAGGMAAFSTNSPVAPAAGACSNALGCARGYWVNLFNASGAVGVDGSCSTGIDGGTRASGFTGGGLPPSPVIGTVPIDGVPVTVCIGCANKEGGPSEVINPGKLKPSIKLKRKLQYWKSSGDN